MMQRRTLRVSTESIGTHSDTGAFGRPPCFDEPVGFDMKMTKSRQMKVQDILFEMTEISAMSASGALGIRWISGVIANLAKPNFSIRLIVCSRLITFPFDNEINL